MAQFNEKGRAFFPILLKRTVLDLPTVDCGGVSSRASKTHGHTDRRFLIFWHNLTKFFQFLYSFIAISDHNSAQNFVNLNSDRAKEFTFGRFHVKGPRKTVNVKKLIFFKWNVKDNRAN